MNRCYICGKIISDRFVYCFLCYVLFIRDARLFVADEKGNVVAQPIKIFNEATT